MFFNFYVEVLIFILCMITDVAVDWNLREQVRNIIFDVIKSIRKKSMQPDTDAIVEHVTRNQKNIK